MKVLVDGDILVYRCGFAVEKNKYNVFIKGEEHFGPVAIYRYKKEIPKYYTDDVDCYLVKEKELEPLENALQAAKELLRSIVLSVGASSYTIYLTGKDNFREKLAVTKPYKGNRDPDYKPVYYKEIQEYLKTQHNAIVVDGQEADDAIGIEQYNNYEKDDSQLYQACDSIIATIDKDLDMIPGWHYNFVKKEKYFVTEEEAIKNFYTQLLTGDATDNVQGVVGVGKKTAAKILANCKSEMDMFNACLATYKDTALLQEMASLLWIRRSEEDMWKPPV